ncbi:MAG: TonB-dependent receptor [Bryobacterales bacterium]|nr:TonB-dependent receptor [Bryobacterales bacterium]
MKDFAWNVMRAVVVICALLCGIMPTAVAQETRGQILGRVTDQSGAVIVGASVKAVNTATNVMTSGRTNESGDFLLPFLLPGVYKVTVEMPGFRDYVRSGIQLSIAERATLNVQLELGEATSSIVVESTTPLVESATASLGQVIDNQRITELPLKDGNPVMLSYLTPGVMNLSTGGWSRPFDNSSPSAISSDGARTGTNEFTIDGAPNTQRGNVAYIPPTEAVQEFKIQTATFDAAMGYTMSAVVNVSLKSGTNELHGSAYDFLQNTKLNANSYFNNLNGLPRSPVKQNRWGASLSGPVFIPKFYDGRNRTFWTYAYEGIHSAAIESAYSFSVPTAKERTGDFSDLLALGSQYQVYDPNTTTPAGSGRFSRQPFAGNVIPTSRINPTGKAIMSYIPLPNQVGTIDGGKNWYWPGPESDSFYSHFFRIDQSINENHRIFVRGNINHRLQDYEHRFNNQAAGSFFSRDNKGLNFDDVYVFSPSFLMNTRYSYTRYLQGDDPISRGMSLSSLGFSQAFESQVKSLDPRGLKFPYITFEDIEMSPHTYGFRFDDTHDVAANLTNIIRSHTVRYGVGFRAYRENNFDLGQASGSFDFGSGGRVGGPFDNSPGAPLGQGFAAALLGLPSSGSISVNDNFAEQSRIWSAYTQDDWKVTSRLTLNLGLRYEVELPTTERYNRTVLGFDSTTASPLQAQAQTNYALNPIPQIPVDQFRVLGGLTFAGIGGNPRGLWNTNRNNLMPRIGAAYSIDPKTVIRGGFGVFYDQIGILRRQVNQAGFSKTTTYVDSLDNGITYIANLTNPFPGGYDMPSGASLGIMTNAGQGLSFFNPKLHNPYMQRWQLSVQRELPGQSVIEVSYVGNHGSDLRTSRQFNPVPRQYYSTSPVRDQAAIDFLSAQVKNPFYPMLPKTSLSGSNTSRGQLLRPYPQFTGISYDTNEGSSRYSSLQTRFEKRMSSGFTVNLAWTWAKLLESTGFLNDTDPLPERVISDQDRAHRVVVSGVWELPFGRGRWLASSVNPVMNKLIEGWQVGAVFQAQGGAPLGFGNMIFTGDLHDIPLSKGERSIYRWFNTSAGFERDSKKQLGSNIRTVSTRFAGVRGPGLNNWDISMVKNTTLTEQFKLQFRAEFNNALNHAQFSNPNTSPTSSSFGRITSTSQWPRTIQFALKLLF